MKKLWNRTRSRSRRQSETRPTTVKSNASKTELATPPVPPLPRTSQSMQRPTGADNANKHRPVLVGVSRPGDFSSRPGTAGSLQNAVSLAADKTSQEFARGHTRSKSPRSVDIFSVSSPRSIASAYNEEIAERNLDIRVARADQRRAYVPSSRYQEEVALRNSYQSSEAPRSSSDRNHRSWLSSGTESGPSREHTPHHSWSNKLQHPLSASETPPPTSPHQTVYTTGAWLDPGPEAADASEQTPTMSVHPGVSSAPAGPVSAGLAHYNLSRSEVSQPRQNDYVPTRSSSRMSATSSQTPVINLAHRTIMDLTGDDDADTHAQSPQAQPPHPETLVTSHTPQDKQQHQTSSNGGQPTHTHLDFPDKNDTAKLPEALTAPVHVVTQMEPQNKQGPTQKQQSSSFSTISTLASSSPTTHTATVPQVAPPRGHVAAQMMSAPAAYRLSTVAEKAETETDAEDSFDISVPTSPEPTDKLVAHTAGTADNAHKYSKAAVQKEPGRDAVPQLAPKHIQSSPRSVPADDFVESNNVYGVRARDFAVAPTRTVLRAEREANTKAKVSKTGSASGEGDAALPTTNGVSGDSSPDSFDEEAFKRKREQARAALVKLQQSLNEEFLPPPREEPASRPNRMNGVGQRRVPTGRPNIDPHGPVAPPSISTTGREHTANGIEAAELKGSKGIPATSLQGMGARPSPNAYGSGSSSSTVRPNGRVSSRQPLQQSQPNAQMRARSTDKKGKGKEREIDAALYELQRTAEEIAGAPRSTLAQSRRAPPSLSERRTGSAAGGLDRGIQGYGYGQVEIKRPHTMANNNGPVPPSPGDVSLSNFPIAPRPHQGASAAPTVPTGPRSYGHHKSDSVDERDFATDRLKRRGSTTSQASHMTSTSQYSIPIHMIPERGSSMRDSSVREED